MARRGDIAALGALAALGAGILENKRNKDKVPVESLESAGKTKSEEKDYGPDYEREVARAGRGSVASMESKVAPTKTQVPAKAESKPSTQGYTRGKEQLSDYQMRQARDLEKGKTRGRPAEGAPRTTTGWTMPSGTEERKRLEEVDQPIERVYPEQMIGAPSLKTLHAAAKSLAGTASAPAKTAAKQAWERAVTADRLTPARAATSPAARQAAQEAEREAVTNPLQWMAGPRGELGRKAMSEADTTGGAIGYKKGGSAKPAAKGWGKARGARQAKYY